MSTKIFHDAAMYYFFLNQKKRTLNAEAMISGLHLGNRLLSVRAVQAENVIECSRIIYLQQICYNWPTNRYNRSFIVICISTVRHNYDETACSNIIITYSTKH